MAVATGINSDTVVSEHKRNLFVYLFLVKTRFGAFHRVLKDNLTLPGPVTLIELPCICINWF